MTKGEDLMDQFMAMANTLPQPGPDGKQLPTSVLFSNYKKQVEFFNEMYAVAWQDGVDDADKVRNSIKSN